MARIQEISNRTHVARTPKPSHLIAQQQFPLGSVGKVFDGQKQNIQAIIKRSSIILQDSKLKGFVLPKSLNVFF